MTWPRRSRTRSRWAVGARHAGAACAMQRLPGGVVTMARTTRTRARKWAWALTAACCPPRSWRPRPSPRRSRPCAASARRTRAPRSRRRRCPRWARALQTASTWRAWRRRPPPRGPSAAGRPRAIRGETRSAPRGPRWAPAPTPEAPTRRRCAWRYLRLSSASSSRTPWRASCPDCSRPRVARAGTRHAHQRSPRRPRRGALAPPTTRTTTCQRRCTARPASGVAPHLCAHWSRPCWAHSGAGRAQRRRATARATWSATRHASPRLSTAGAGPVATAARGAPAATVGQRGAALSHPSPLTRAGARLRVTLGAQRTAGAAASRRWMRRGTDPRALSWAGR
mmetsp:Transcript_15681/g.42114  ORF Transcript_15681/g.42114 Transcript_15681/m.42114 type:complete len:339 (+) Transcript_15681:742-1758(+)